MPLHDERELMREAVATAAKLMHWTPEQLLLAVRTFQTCLQEVRMRALREARGPKVNGKEAKRRLDIERAANGGQRLVGE